MLGVGGAAVLAVAGCEQEVVERIVEVEVMVEPPAAEEPAPTGPAEVWRTGIFEDVTTHNFFNILGPGQTAWNFYAFMNRYPSLYGLSDSEIRRGAGAGGWFPGSVYRRS